MTTVSDLIERTRAHLLADTREELNTLAAPFTIGGTSLTLTYPSNTVAAGAHLQVGLEVFRVMAVSGTTATVIPARMGSTAANHSTGDVVRVNPRFFDHLILSDMNNCLDDLTAQGIYKEVSLNIAFSPQISAYDLTGATTVLDVLEVRYQIPGPSQRFPVIPEWSLMRGMDTTVFPSGTALVIDSPGYPGLNLRVRYAAPFTYMVNLTDDVQATVGLSSTANDLPPFGAAVRQMLGREIKRSFTEAQPDTRRSTEVPAGAAAASLRELKAAYANGIIEERYRQIQRYPLRNR